MSAKQSWSEFRASIESEIHPQIVDPYDNTVYQGPRPDRPRKRRISKADMDAKVEAAMAMMIKGETNEEVRRVTEFSPAKIKEIRGRLVASHGEIKCPCGKLAGHLGCCIVRKNKAIDRGWKRMSL